MYTIVVAGKPQGPYSLAELKQFEIQPTTFLKKIGMDDYKEAHEIEEIRQLMGFVIPKNTPQYFASFDQRLMAWAIDFFLITLGYAILLLVAFLVLEEKSTQIMFLIAGVVLIPLTKFCYSIVGDCSKTQGTIGKKLLDIKVTDEYGARITLIRSVSRSFAKVVSIVPLGLGYVYSFFNKKQQCLHDVMAGTLVIKDRLL